MENNKIFTLEDIDIKANSFILITSKRCSGKTVLVRHLLKYLLEKFDFSVIIMFSDTSSFNDDYLFIDKDLIFLTSELEPKLNKLLKIQKQNIKNKKIINILVLLDDVQIHAKSKELINLSTYGRHFKITTILSSQ